MVKLLRCGLKWDLGGSRHTNRCNSSVKLGGKKRENYGDYGMELLNEICMLASILRDGCLKRLKKKITSYIK